MLKITKISVKNLLEFSQSELYNSFENKPISPARVASYSNNPNANKGDTILYMAFIADELVGYRTVFSDVFFDGNKKEKFAWLSGNWTHPKHRRKNISTLLFKEVAKDWENKLLYSNYAEASKLLYDKTNEFSTLKTLRGKRYYRRFCFTEVLPPKHYILKKTAFLLRLIDGVLNLLLSTKRYKNSLLKNYSIQKITDWNIEEINSFYLSFKKDELFKRTPQTYDWILSFPWIKTDLQTKEFSKNYHFSTYTSKFENTFYCIKKNDDLIAIVNISIRDGHLKVPYFYGISDGVIPSVLLILEKCETHAINYFTIYNEALNSELSKHRFLYQKDFRQGFFIATDLLNKHPEIRDKSINSGDGDSVFT